MMSHSIIPSSKNKVKPLVFCPIIDYSSMMTNVRSYSITMTFLIHHLEPIYQIPKITNLLPSKPRPSITHQALIRYRLGTLATIRRDNSQLSNGILCACNSRSPNNGFYCFKKKNIRLLNN